MTSKAIKTNPDVIADWYRTHRTRLAGHGAWLDGGEPGRITPAAFDSARIRILFCRLSTYRDVLPSLSHRMLYWAATTVDGVYPDLAWLPPSRDAEIMTAAGIPWWTASGAKQPPTAFDVVAIGISTPQEALNLPTALERSGIALSHAGRMNDPLQPLVILGGQAAASVPFIHGDCGREPGSGGLVDAVCLGDGIGWLRDFIALYLSASRSPDRKTTVLSQLATQVPGSYIPSFYRHSIASDGQHAIEIARPGTPLPALHRTDPPETWTTGYDGAYIPFDEEDREETLPLAFGCRYRCRFCQTGWIRANLMPTGNEPLLQCATRLKQAMAASDLNLLASDACSVAGLGGLSGELLKLFRHVSVKSLALASLARGDTAAAVTRLLDKKEFTLGVEGISGRLRRWLGKQADAATLVAALRRSAASGVRQLKLFFILTGRETETDISEFHDWLVDARGALSSRIMTSFTPLFHAPFTPFQFAEIRPLDERLLSAIRKSATQAGAEFRLSAPPAEIHLVNLICRAGRRGTSTLMHLALDRGFRYDDSIPAEALDTARAHLAARGISEAALVRDMTDGVLPWDDIQAGHARERLLESAREAAVGNTTDPGSPAAGQLAPVTPPPGARPAPARPTPEQLLSAWVRLETADVWRPDVTIARGLLRARFAGHPALARTYRGQPRLVRFPFASGVAMLQASFPADALEEALGGPPTEPLPESPWFLVRFNAGAPDLHPVLDALRRKRTPFQSRRRSDGLWHIVSPTHRTATGLAAVIEAPDSWKILAGAGLRDWLQADFESLAGGGIAEAVYALEPPKCKSCGSRVLRLLHPAANPFLPPDSLCAH